VPAPVALAFQVICSQGTGLAAVHEHVEPTTTSMGSVPPALATFADVTDMDAGHDGGGGGGAGPPAAAEYLADRRVKK